MIKKMAIGCLLLGWLSCLKVSLLEAASQRSLKKNWGSPPVHCPRNALESEQSVAWTRWLQEDPRYANCFISKEVARKLEEKSVQFLRQYQNQDLRLGPLFHIPLQGCNQSLQAQLEPFAFSEGVPQKVMWNFFLPPADPLRSREGRDVLASAHSPSVALRVRVASLSQGQNKNQVTFLSCLKRPLTEEVSKLQRENFLVSKEKPKIHTFLGQSFFLEPDLPKVRMQKLSISDQKKVLLEMANTALQYQSLGKYEQLLSRTPQESWERSVLEGMHPDPEQRKLSEIFKSKLSSDP